MLLWLSHWLSHSLHFLRVFNYLTFRSIVSTLTALFIMLFFGPTLIKKLTFMSIGQSVRGDGPQTHLGKAGTPTMGGALILISISISVLLWCDLTNIYVWLTLLTMLSFGLIGFVDDYKKLVYRNSKGLAPRWKLIWQVVFAVLWIGIYFHYAYLPSQTALYVPFFKNMLPDLGVWSAVLALLVIVGSSNAVNLTDGLDGLAILPTVLIAFALAIFSYLTGNAIFANYLAIPFVPGSGELAVFCSTVVGAGLGFLWFNTYPAQVFMGDVGSLGLGAMLGMIAVLVRQEIVFMVMGGVFVMETISVILQVASFKLTGKRIFKMAPLHHHFELKGWPEPRVIVRFWIVTFILVLCGLATLKLR